MVRRDRARDAQGQLADLVADGGKRTRGRGLMSMQTGVIVLQVTRGFGEHLP